MRKEKPSDTGATTESRKSTEAARAARLKAALKANIAKRKAQARLRESGPASKDKDNA